LTAAKHFDRRDAIDPLAVEDADQIVDAGDRQTIKPHDGVEAHQPGERGGAMRLERGDHCTRRILDARCKRLPAGNGRRLCRYPDIGAPNATMLDQFAENKPGGVTCDREADALRAHDDRRIDSDDLPSRRHQGASGIPRIEGGISLDYVLDQPTRARA